MLGNLSPKLRSTTHGIQLLILAKYLVIAKHGIDKILEPFIKDMLKLVSLFVCITMCDLFKLGSRT